MYPIISGVMAIVFGLYVIVRRENIVKTIMNFQANVMHYHYSKWQEKASLIIATMAGIVLILFGFQWVYEALF